jgi:hypothetical protein
VDDGKTKNPAQEASCDLRNAQEGVMEDNHCPKCGGSDVVPRTVNDRLRAADPHGHIFEVPLQVLVWSCGACKLCWQGREAAAAMEAAYQNALAKYSPTQTAA